jgi:4-amino-4-deoxy-L-arabinose transferase-like glycosyltransferase
MPPSHEATLPRALAWAGGAGSRLLRPILVIAALAATFVYVALAIVHLRYPFELEWMEGGMVDAVRRVVAGQKIYVKPSLEFAPYIYTPLYYYVAAAFAKVFGAGFFSARLVSVVASLGAIGIIARFVQRETQSVIHGVIAGGLYAATYSILGAFHDLARVDSLFVVMLLAGMYAVRFWSGPRGRVIAAALFALAFLTKQSASLVMAPIALHLLIAERRRALWFIGPAVLLTGGSLLLLDWIHDGWLRYYVFWIPQQHPLRHEMALVYWVRFLLRPFPVGCLLSLGYLALEKRAEVRWFYAASLAGALAIGWTGSLHFFGWTNVNMPAFAVLSILFGLGLSAAVARAARWRAPWRMGAEAALLVAALAQFEHVAYDPRHFLPSQEDREAGAQLVAAIAGAEGDVFVPGHAYLSALAGKRTYVHEMALKDILSFGGGKPGEELLAEVEQAIAEKRFSTLIIDRDWKAWPPAKIDAGYVQKGVLSASRQAFLPPTWMHPQPVRLLVAR